MSEEKDVEYCQGCGGELEAVTYGPDGYLCDDCLAGVDDE